MNEAMLSVARNMIGVFFMAFSKSFGFSICKGAYAADDAVQPAWC